jgi:hypothetical protein
VTNEQSRKRTWVVALAGVGSLMAALDTLVVASALSTIRPDLRAASLLRARRGPLRGGVGGVRAGGPDRGAPADGHGAAVAGLALHRLEPDGLRYATFKLPDGVTFIHLADSDGAGSPLSDLAAFKAFQAGVRERCDEPPVVSELSEIGSFAW